MLDYPQCECYKDKDHICEVTLSDIVSQSAAILREALTLGRTTIERVREQQERDIETVRVREYWGDRNDEQRLVTQGIKLRIAARKRILEAEE